MAGAALSFKDVTKVYVRSHLGRTYRTRGIDSLTLELQPGEVFGLLGLNGSGKTTTMKLALGLLRPTRGHIQVFGQPAGDPGSLSRIGYLPELPYFYPYLTPREVLSYYGRLSGLSGSPLAEHVKAALERVGLVASADRKMSEFSKGMLQRVGVAQALQHEPQLLILDEPVSGLDPLAIAEFRELFQRLNEEGKTIVLSSHSISEVEKVCHRVGILADGRLIRLLDQKQWEGEPGRLERLFVDTVTAALRKK